MENTWDRLEAKDKVSENLQSGALHKTDFKTWVSKLGPTIYACNPSPWEEEELRVSLGYNRPKAQADRREKGERETQMLQQGKA